MQRLSTWQILKEVDKLLANSHGWQPITWDQPRGIETYTDRQFLDRKRRKRLRDTSKRQ